MRLFNSSFVYHLLVVMLLVVPHSIYTTYIARKDMGLYFLNILVIDGLLLSIIYLNLFYLIPVFHKRKKYAVYFLGLVVLVTIFFYASYQMGAMVQKALKFPDEPIIYFIVSTTVNIVQYLLISFFLFNLKEKTDQQKRMDEIQLENLKTEINYLRAQINPHFLFNTLNNLYGLALEKSDRTPGIILRLSKMMDYMLFESDDALVYLKKEVENIENYVEIEKIRQGNNATIKFHVEGSAAAHKIVPLLLLPLIENSFKHGINTMISDAYLDIHLSVDPASVSLHVINSYKLVNTGAADGRNKIGLQNLKRRLELFYPGKYQLSMNGENNIFEASLKISLL